MKESFKITETFNTTPEELFKAWLSSETHTNMTGGAANCSDKIGVTFSAWDGYIFGKNLELIPNSKIVQTWRTTEFEENDEDSILEIELNENEDQTTLTLIHSNIPEGMTQYKQGWKDHYFDPMKDYFNSN